MVKICLNMIVKNEAKIIERCLDSVKDIINGLAILDTGSTDGTPEIIAAWALRYGIPFQVYYGKFTNFGDSRNEALRLLGESSLNYDYILFLDAGMVVQETNQEWRNIIKFPNHWTIKQKLGNIRYYNSRLVHKSMPMQWVGPVHEYLACPGPIKLDGLEIQCYQDGGNQEGQMERYRDILIDHIEKNPDDARSIFYLAQTFFDLGEYEFAHDNYERRINLGGWDEEVFYSLYKQALISIHEATYTGDVSVVNDCIRAWAYRPHRAEPLNALLAYLGKGSMPKFPKTNDELFVEGALYE